MKGWYKESARHSLAAKGVPTGKKLKIKTIKIKPDYKKGYDILMDYWDSFPDGEKEEMDLLLQQYESKNDYKNAYGILIEYFDSISDDEKSIVDKKLRSVGL